MIRLTILGNLGNDAEIKDVNGKKVITFSVCHTEKWKDQQGTQQSKSVWVNCDYWTDKTGIAQYLTKGSTVWVEGEPIAHAYLDAQGKVHSQQKMRVHRIDLISSKQQQDTTPEFLKNNDIDNDENFK